MLIGIKMAGARDAALDLVGYQHQGARVANVAQRLQEGLRRRANAALALNRLDEEAGRVVVDQIERVVDVVERRIGEARQLRVETLAQLFLIGRRYRAERAAVEGVVEGDQIMLFSVARARMIGRSEERRVGKEGVSTGRSRWWP